ncbi:hypothetical protein ACWCZ5_30395 [Streptomyces sp. NPDC001667]
MPATVPLDAVGIWDPKVQEILAALDPCANVQSVLILQQHR